MAARGRVGGTGAGAGAGAVTAIVTAMAAAGGGGGGGGGLVPPSSSLGAGAVTGQFESLRGTWIEPLPLMRQAVQIHAYTKTLFQSTLHTSVVGIAAVHLLT